MRTCIALITLAALAATFAPAVAEDMPKMPVTPAAAADLLYAQPFMMEKPDRHDWRKEAQDFTDGYVLVLKVNPDLVFPRATGMPVLFVGDQTARTINLGHKSGKLVLIVPGKVDLAKDPVWFGTPGLPGDVDAEKLAAERKLAEEAGIKPFGKDTVREALKEGGETLKTKDFKGIEPTLGKLIEKYAPDEADLARDLQRRRD
jgi:hypothetical protein